MAQGIPNAVVTCLTTHARHSAMRVQSISGVTSKAIILLRSCVVARRWCYVMEETTHDAVAKRVITGKYSMMISMRFIMIVRIFVADDCDICRCWPEARHQFASTRQLKFLAASKTFPCIVLPLSSPPQQDNFLNFRDFPKSTFIIQ